jgi:hypothetical protein
VSVALWLLLYTFTTNPCQDVCEVLDMEFVARTSCECVCYDPPTKRLERYVDPACTGE